MQVILLFSRNHCFFKSFCLQYLLAHSQFSEFPRFNKTDCICHHFSLKSSVLSVPPRTSYRHEGDILSSCAFRATDTRSCAAQSPSTASPCSWTSSATPSSGSSTPLHASASGATPYLLWASCVICWKWLKIAKLEWWGLGWWKPVQLASD